MGPTPDQIQLIREYEPALFFVGDMGSPGAERFFPSDAKRYLEKAALYRINATDETKAQWGNPILGAGTISGAAGENGKFIGDPDASVPPKFPFLQTDPDKELFLDVAGWRSANRFADLDHMAALYAGDLNDSRFRYHAEFFDADRLRRLFDSPGNTALGALFDPRPTKPPVLTDPALLCYYLFFPAHEESLNGCTDSDGHLLESARDFASFAGEWSCIAILFDRANIAQPYLPKWVGLSNRNTGQINVGTGEIRSTMRVLPWSAMVLYETTHAQFNVGIGSHGLYVNGESLPAVSYTDPTAVNCGAAAPIVRPPAVQTDHVATDFFVGLKVVLGMGLLGPIGAVAGLVWGLTETPVVVYSFATPYLPGSSDSVSSTGFVIHPKGKPPPGVQPGDPAHSAEWKSDPLDIGNRHYDFTVDRATQPFWGEDPEAHGYTGRWGPRVEGDTIRRRAGMSFPKFWELFFSSLVRADPPSRTIVLTTELGSTWTVPADWNNAINSVECIGGGGGGGGGNLAGARAGGGGAGGEYRKETNVALTPGATVPVSFGAGGAGGAIGMDGAAGGDTVFNTGSVVAKGGGGGGTLGTAGAWVPGGVGSESHAGGAGGSATGGPFTNGGAGGGGAGGPLGGGGAGGSGLDATGSGAGGGGNSGGTRGMPSMGSGVSAPGADGGNNAGGTGGGHGGAATPEAPVAGTNGGGGGGGPFVVPGLSFGGAEGGDGIDLDSAHGSGGGGGGGGTGGSNQPDSGTPGGPGGNYGGGGGGGSQVGGVGAGAGGDGAEGLIVIRYTPAF